MAYKIGGLVVLPLSARRAALQEAEYLVYQGFDQAGIVRYVGITSRALATRVAEHQAAVGTGKELLQYDIVPGAEGLSRLGARTFEQRLINQYGLGRNGGQLLNRINSIARRYWEELGIE